MGRFRASVARDLRGIPEQTCNASWPGSKVSATIRGRQAAGSFPGEERYRLRQGNYRILCTVADAELVGSIT